MMPLQTDIVCLMQKPEEGRVELIRRSQSELMDDIPPDRGAAAKSGLISARSPYRR
jgi:hypothetical protein